MVDQIITGNIIGTSTVVYNYKKFRDLRYLQNFKHTGPEYIFWISLAAGSEKIAFSIDSGVPLRRRCKHILRIELGHG